MSIRTRLIALLLLLGLIFASTPVLAQGPRPGQPVNRRNQANADDAAAIAGGMMCVIGVAALIGIGLKIAIIIFIVTDAKKRGMDPTMWVILEIFVGLIGLIVYLCVREPLLSERRRRRREYEEDEEEELDRPQRSRRLRDRDDDDYDRPRRSKPRRDDNDGRNPFDFN